MNIIVEPAQVAEMDRVLAQRPIGTSTSGTINADHFFPQKRPDLVVGWLRAPADYSAKLCGLWVAGRDVADSSQR